jgi:hypothetical protein
MPCSTANNAGNLHAAPAAQQNNLLQNLTAVVEAYNNPTPGLPCKLASARMHL